MKLEVENCQQTALEKEKKLQLALVQITSYQVFLSSFSVVSNFYFYFYNCYK